MSSEALRPGSPAASPSGRVGAVGQRRRRGGARRQRRREAARRVLRRRPGRIQRTPTAGCQVRETVAPEQDPGIDRAVGDGGLDGCGLDRPLLLSPSCAQYHMANDLTALVAPQNRNYTREVAPSASSNQSTARRARCIFQGRRLRLAANAGRTFEADMSAEPAARPCVLHNLVERPAGRMRPTRQRGASSAFAPAADMR